MAERRHFCKPLAFEVGRRRYDARTEERSLLTVTEAQKIVAKAKRLVVPLEWSKKLNHTEPAWHQYRSALEFVDDPTETPEGLLIVCQWKRREGPKPENWTFGLIYGADRIYAIDAQPLSRHTNTVGTGRPLFRQLIQGTHEHTWSDEGYGYVEPFSVASLDGQLLWSEFLKRAGIETAPFVHPDKAINDGQQELQL